MYECIFLIYFLMFFKIHSTKLILAFVRRLNRHVPRIFPSTSCLPNVSTENTRETKKIQVYLYRMIYRDTRQSYVFAECPIKNILANRPALTVSKSAFYGSVFLNKIIY